MALVQKVSLTQSEKTEARIQKVLASLCEGKSTTLADLREVSRIVNRDLSTLMQDGDGKGKRFPGAVSHELEANAAAYVAIIRRGNLARPMTEAKAKNPA